MKLPTDLFLRLSIINLIFMVMFGSSIAPYQTQVQGLYLSVFIISLFGLARSAGGYFNLY